MAGADMTIPDFIVYVTLALLTAPMFAFVIFLLMMAGMGVLTGVVWLAEKLWWRIE